MTMLRTLTTLTLLLTLTACDRAQREEARNERAEQCYQDAITRYKAGDIEAAEEGFRTAVKESPGNVSARFQLAVLLQEGRKDYLGALCCYRDCLLLAPGNDKSQMARERAEKCELLFVKQMAEKYGYSKADALQKELEEMQSTLAGAQADIVNLRDENKALRGELDRFKGVRTTQVARPPVSTPRPVTPVVRPPAAPVSVPEAQDVRPSLGVQRPQDEAQDNEQGLRAARALLDDARGDTAAESAIGSAGGETGARPRRYRVKSGDGLYSIARANYPEMSVHKAVELITKANPRKATSSLKPGDELILP